MRKAARQVERDDDADADAVAPAEPQPDVLAARDFLAKVMKVPAGDEPLVRTYERYKLGDAQLKDLAKEERIPYRTLQSRIVQFEKHLRKRARTMLKSGRISGILAALLLALGISRWELEPAPGMMHDDPGPISVLEPAVSTHVTQVDPLDWAAVLRGEAFRDCLDLRWERCLDGLDAARELDPDGDVDAAVQAARVDATTGITSGEKPGPTWRPWGARPYAAKASK